MAYNGGYPGVDMGVTQPELFEDLTPRQSRDKAPAVAPVFVRRRLSVSCTAQQAALALSALMALIGLTLIPLGNKPA